MRWRLLWSIIRRSAADKVIGAFLVNYLIVSVLIMFIEPNIESFGDALWYVFVASTSIGFGDFAAVTIPGRLLTVYITIHEILMVAIISGVVVGYYLEVIHRRENESLTLFMDKLEHLPSLSREELEIISEKIKKLK